MTYDVLEMLEQIITRLLGGINQEIANLVKLQPYWSLENVCKLVMNVEKQLKRGMGLSTKSSTKGTSLLKGVSSNKVGDTSKKDKGKEKTSQCIKELPQKSDFSIRKCRVSCL